MSLKENWKETGDSLGKAFTDLGKTLVRTVCAGVKKAEAWANEETPASAAEKAPASQSTPLDEAAPEEQEPTKQ